MLSHFFLAYTLILAFFPCGVAVIICMQLAADKYSEHAVHRTKLTKTFLYSLYILSFLCGCVGFSLHSNSTNRIWCEVWGSPVCLGLYGATKSAVYLFFFNRAQIANGIITNKYLEYFFKYVSKIYIFLYWVIYLVISCTLFTMEMNEANTKYSFCFFSNSQWWFIVLAAIADLVNCVLAVSLFVHPLIKASYEIKTNGDLVKHMDHEAYLKQLGFITIMKWNVVLSALTVLSSAITLVSIPLAKHFMWVFCVGDPFLNSLCIFFMHGANRRFVKKVLCFDFVCCLKRSMKDNDSVLDASPPSSAVNAAKTGLPSSIPKMVTNFTLSNANSVASNDTATSTADTCTIDVLPEDH